MLCRALDTNWTAASFTAMGELWEIYGESFGFSFFCFFFTLQGVSDPQPCDFNLGLLFMSLLEGFTHSFQLHSDCCVNIISRRAGWREIKFEFCKQDIVFNTGYKLCDDNLML